MRSEVIMARIVRVKDFVVSCCHWLPISVRGVVLVAASLVALRYLALQQHDRLILAACAGSLFLFIVFSLAVLSVALWLRFAHLSVDANVDAMESVPRPTGLVLAFVPSIPCIVIDIRWVNCKGIDVTLVRQHDGFQETIVPRQRLQRSEVIRQFEVSDLFGLSRVQFQRTFLQSVRVEPMPAAKCSITQIRRDQQGDDLAHPGGKPHGDLIEMRHYRPGDPLKLVLWKHYARTRQLLVRQPENSIACLSQTIACLVAGPGDQASAGVARTVVTELTQAGEEILFQADGSSTATDSSLEAIQQIIQSADSQHHGGNVVAAIAKMVHGNTLQHCIAFVPSQPGPWIDRVLAGQAVCRLKIDAIIGVDDAPVPSHSRLIPTWAYHRDVDGMQPNGVAVVVERLSAAGISTRVIHRRSGQIFVGKVLQGI